MGILRLKLVDASGAVLPGQTVKVSGAGALQTNSDGLVQFLLEAGVLLEIQINGTVAWSGDPAQLAKDELFKASGPGFSRVSQTTLGGP